MIYLHYGKKAVISSLSDICELSPDSSIIHFRKFLSKKLVLDIFERCFGIQKVLISKSAYFRCDEECIQFLESRGIEIVVSDSRGRPSFLETAKEMIS